MHCLSTNTTKAAGAGEKPRGSFQRGCVGVVEIGSGKGVAVDQLVAMNGIDVPIKEGSDAEQDENVLESSSLRTLGWRPLVDVMEVDIKEYL